MNYETCKIIWQYCIAANCLQLSRFIVESLAIDYGKNRVNYDAVAAVHISSNRYRPIYVAGGSFCLS